LFSGTALYSATQSDKSLIRPTGIDWNLWGTRSAVGRSGEQSWAYAGHTGIPLTHHTHT